MSYDNVIGLPLWATLKLIEKVMTVAAAADDDDDVLAGELLEEE